MTSFRTVLKLGDSPFQFDHGHTIFSMGSCFAVHIAQQLENAKFSSYSNPFGILYNPVSIAKSLANLCGGKSYTEEDLFFQEGLWNSFDHHGSFSDIDVASMLDNINETLANYRKGFSETDILICTLGTAHVFEYRKTGEIVANCHKLPGQEFNRRRLGVDEITSALAEVVRSVLVQRPQLKMIFTVSPVRHIRDGLIENQLSKATLLLAIAELAKLVDSVYYFPAYELLVDDLRDYRYYNRDMIHPNEMAVDYIWDAFRQYFVTNSTEQLISQIDKLRRAALHRPLHVNSTKHQQFLHAQLNKLAEIQSKYPTLNFDKEERLLRAQLLNDKTDL